MSEGEMLKWVSGFRGVIVASLCLGFVLGLLVFGTSGCSPQGCDNGAGGGNEGTGEGGNGGNAADGGNAPSACNYSGSYEFCTDGFVICELCKCEYARCTVANADAQNVARVGYCVLVDADGGKMLTCSEPCNGSLCH